MSQLMGRFIKAQLGCTRVVAWNSVCRRNDPENVKLKHVDRQQRPEEGFVPTSRLQPVAGFAHVDQDATWGKELCSRAAQRPADEFKRCQIVNIWRPLMGECCSQTELMTRSRDKRTIGRAPVCIAKAQIPLGARAPVWHRLRHSPRPDARVGVYPAPDARRDYSAQVLRLGE